MSTVIINAKTQYGITDTIIGRGCACEVYKTENPNMVFKLYYDYFDFDDVQQNWKRHKLYAQKGLAPQLYGEIIKFDGRYGFFVERITSPHKLSLIEFNKLQDQLKTAIKDNMNTDELDHNWGITKEGKPVLYDFCEITLKLMGLVK